MGIYRNISIDNFPRQGDDLGSMVRLNLDIHRADVPAMIVRSDSEKILIHLNDTRVVESTECMYNPILNGGRK